MLHLAFPQKVLQCGQCSSDEVVRANLHEPLEQYWYWSHESYQSCYGLPASVLPQFNALTVQDRRSFGVPTSHSTPSSKKGYDFRDHTP